MRTFFVLMLLTISFFAAMPVQSTSLFDEDGCDLFTALRADDIGDLVTIVVLESTSASNEAGVQTGKTLNTDGELTVKGFLQWVAGMPDVIAPIEDLTFTPSEDFQGDGKVTARGQFSTRITAVVTDILPNGNLLIEAARDITIAEDTATLGVRGVIQPQDISADNTVMSYQISEMELIYEGEGIINDRQHDGILSKIFNFFF